MILKLLRALGAVLFSLLLYPLGFIFLWLPKRMRFTSLLYGRLIAFWARNYLRILGIRYEISGRTDLLKASGQSYIFVANHQSLLDGLLLSAQFGERTHFYLVKQSLMFYPLVNFFFIRMHVLVSRNQPRKAVRALKKAIERARTYQNDMVIFPEGRRYRDGQIHNFFHGFASASSSLSVPVVPVRIVGMDKLCTENSWLVDSYAPPIKLIIGEPMVRGDSEPLEHFSERVRSWFL